MCRGIWLALASMWRRLSSIVLIGLLTLPITGTYLWLQYQRRAVRHEVKQRMIRGLDASELVHLTFSFEETRTKLQWAHAGEFMYQQQKYDIVSADTAEGQVTYHCWWDHKESAIERRLNDLTNLALNTGDDRKERSHWMLKTFQIKYLRLQMQYSFGCPLYQRSFPPYFPTAFQSLHPEPAGPPPRRS